MSQRACFSLAMQQRITLSFWFVGLKLSSVEVIKCASPPQVFCAVCKNIRSLKNCLLNVKL